MARANQTSRGFLTIDDVKEKLDKGLEDVFKNQRFKEMLKVMSSFRTYSFNNMMLIMLQRPNATMVKGYKQWQELGRHVKKGEKGIKILAPIIEKIEVEILDPKTKEPLLKPDGTPETKEITSIKAVKTVTVFDISQTEGREIPNVRDFINRDLQNDESIAKLYKDFVNYINNEGKVTVKEQETELGVGGYFAPYENEIVISTNTNKNDTEKFRVLIHEYAHAKLHNLESEYKELPREHKEAQAESVAYIVSNYYGLDTNDISLGYIATWSQNIELARQAINEIQDVANNMIDVLDELQREKIHEFYKESNQQYYIVEEMIQEDFSINLSSLNKENPDIQFEVIQKDRGNVLSGRLEYSNQTEKFQLRLNNNQIIPLDELAKDGNYHALNIEVMDGQVPLDHYREAKDFQVRLLPDENKLGVIYQKDDKSDEIHLVSPKFEENEFKLAEKHLARINISQLLHHEVFLKSQKFEPSMQDNINQRLNEIGQQLNVHVGKYLSNDKIEFLPTGDGGKAIGWTLMKRPEIKTLDELKEYVDKTKHIASNKNLREAMETATEKTKEVELELE